MKKIINFFFAVFWIVPMVAQPSLSEYKMAIKQNPDNYKIYNQLGLYYVQLKDFTNAKIAFQKSVKIKRDYAKGYYNLGVLLLNQGKYNESIENFITSTIFDTNFYESYVNLANIYNIRNDLSLAQKYYKKSLAIRTNDADVLNNLGVIALKQKQYQKAEQYIEKAYKQKNDEDIKFNLATAYYYENKQEKIEELYPYIGPENKYYNLIMQILNH